MMNPIRCLILILWSGACLSLAAAPEYPEERTASPGHTAYYVDPVHGDDANTGTSDDRPWKSFHPVNRLLLGPGDRLEVSPGRFDHTLSISGKGSVDEPIVVNFRKGRYDMDPVHARREKYAISNTNADPDGLKAVGLHFSHAEHIRVWGDESLLVARGKMMHVCIDACRDLAIARLGFDYHRPTVSEFTVTAVSPESADLSVHKDSAYTIVDDAIIWQGDGWMERGAGGLGQELDPESGRVHRMRDPLAGLKVEEVSPFQLRVHGKHRFKKGLIYQIRNPFRDYCGVFTRDSRDILWQDVHFRFIHGMGLVNQFTENLTFDMVRIEPDPQSGRTTAAWADCIQASGCRGKLMVNGCRFSGAHDDAINIHGTHLRVIASDADRREIEVRFIHDQTYGIEAFRSGDEVEFVRWDSLATYEPNRVVEARLLDPRTMKLRLEKPLPEDIRDKDVLENLTWTPEVEIRGCHVRHIPTRGFLCTTRRKVVIEANEFHATQMPAILIEDDASGWFESGCVRDMLIRDNRFHFCGEPAIHINPRNSLPNPAVHRNIRIEGNTFHLMKRFAVGAKSTTGLRITHNRIHGPEVKGDNAWLRTDDCADVVSSGNEVAGP